jgi:hypothetical protein
MNKGKIYSQSTGNKYIHKESWSETQNRKEKKISMKMELHD